MNVPSEYSLETKDLFWKAELEGVSIEECTLETCCKEEKVNAHEQPGIEEVIPLFPADS